ncbi:MAG: hypothetical protein CMI02_07020 [Oceanospirillaceae bacterium]|nr:hypothetical protein [Oceanospirillaceae bacterium]MBT11768.1 hypothetical protein [Oceanospirillaceae bacterium]|tara:strand:+ start:61452 stop:61982 length:531 start_codon:yes stop_codon:yes gene_type:complete
MLDHLKMTAFQRHLWLLLMIIIGAILLPAVPVSAEPAIAPSDYRQGKATAAELYKEGQRLYEAAGMGGDKSAAVGYFKAAAEQGDLEAQVRLGDMYAFGAGVSPSYESAAYWFTKAAAQGDAKSQLYMGDLYAYGLGVEKDNARALRYMNMALTNENSDSKTRSMAEKRINDLSRQ